MGPESSAAKVVDATALETLLERYPAQGWMVHSEAGVHKGLMDREQVLALCSEWHAASADMEGHWELCIECPPQTERWQAVNDRLRRAAAR